MKFISDMTKKQRKVFLRIIISAILTLITIISPFQGAISAVLYLIAYFVIGYDILKKAIRGILLRQLLDENFLMAAATVGAIILAAKGKSDYLEAVAVMLFYQTGELFQSCAVNKSRKSIAALMDIRPQYANIEKNGELIKVSPQTVCVGDCITVFPGEKVPIDSVVEEGASSLDTAAITGESVPRDVEKGDSVISGCINLSGVLKLKTVKEFSESSVCKILELVENASSRKSKSENSISRFARVYTPAVCICAMLIGFLIPLLLIMSGRDSNFELWLYRALTFLVVSCPCALVISIPLAFFSGLGAAGRKGILIKGSSYMEALAKTDTVVFDKTGTLTMGNFKVRSIVPYGIDKKTLLEYALLAESASNHPISKSLRDECEGFLSTRRVSDIKEISGKGVSAVVEGKLVYVGNARLMKDIDVVCDCICDTGTTVHISVDGKYSGYIAIADEVKANSDVVIKSLKKAGIDKCIMLTGDNEKAAAEAANKAGIDEFYSKLLPQEKVEKLEELLALKKCGSFIAFVGDGINDAPALSIADIGIAMGAIGQEAAIEAADIVIMDDDLTKLPLAILIARRCIRIVKQNTFFAIGIKLLCLGLTAVGITNMWFAIFADVGVMVLAVINALKSP